jgi:hypothetical protein
LVNNALLQTNMAAALTVVNTAIPTIGTLQESPPSTIKTVYNAVQNALAPFNAAIASYDADIDTSSVGGVVATLLPLQMVTALKNQVLDVGNQAITIIAQSYVTRVASNLYNFPG